jgi:hypothetical protein
MNQLLPSKIWTTRFKNDTKYQNFVTERWGKKEKYSIASNI